MDRTSPPRVPASPSVLHFEVRRGRTASPDRPVTVDRFLIGADPLCHLCLGSDELPPLHSVVLTTDEGSWIEAVSAVPELRVNGVAVVGKELNPGDVVAIGPFELVAAWQPISEQDAPSPTALERLTSGEFDCGHNLDHLESVPASELIELIEQEEALLDEFVARRGLGADALLLAALERSRELEEQDEKETVLIAKFPVPAAPESDSFPQPEVASDSEIPLVAGAPGDFEQIVAHLTSVADELNSRADRLARRERAYADAAASLLEAQQKLTEQMESILARLAALEAPQATQTRNVA